MSKNKRRYDGWRVPTSDILITWLKEILATNIRKFYWLFVKSYLSFDDILSEIYIVGSEKLSRWNGKSSQWTTFLYVRVIGKIKDLLYLTQSIVKSSQIKDDKAQFWKSNNIKQDIELNLNIIGNMVDELQIDFSIDLPEIYRKLLDGIELDTEEIKIAREYIVVI